MTYAKTVSLPVPADEAFALVTQPERLRRWMAVTARLELRAGGAWRWTVTPGNVAGGTVREVEPGRRVVLDWGWDLMPGAEGSLGTVTVTVEPAGDGSTVTLVHEGLDVEQEASHAEGWDHFLGRLEVAAAEGDAGPDDWAAAPDPIDELVAAEAALAVLQHVLRQVGPGDGDRATPCSEFTVDELTEHLLGTLVDLGAMAEAELTRPEGADAEDRVAVLAAEVVEAWRRRGLDGMARSPFGEAPAPVLAGIVALELLVHAWDFAQATGAVITVSDELVTYVAGLAERVVPGARGRAFAEESPAPVDADALTRLAAYTGRTPLALV
ncbi:TIGR03086 family protein [Nocardioides aromaticivorans]|uniref:TIGR03086 family protein n=1 Tax=Nocardioides aromaticivorans TaxID=200618 RepID=A0ABX7PIR3_9ACTN|nr:TIGR03086 family metal-binding protein [Nocardioides aromaticivorans]QSR25836.1 TIGR03086 family protein [Nocardioides aromaticivorans]